MYVYERETEEEKRKKRRQIKGVERGEGVAQIMNEWGEGA